MQKLKNFLNQVKTSWGAGLTVALISFPLSIAISDASGVSPLVGLIAAFWGGLIGAYAVKSGPIIVGVGASVISLQVAFLNLAQSLGLNIEERAVMLALLTILAGIFLLIIKVLKLQEYIKYVPASIITGFAAGIGLVIIRGQINNASGVANISEIATKITENFGMFILTPVVFIISYLILVLTKKYLPKIPAAIVVSVPGIILGFLSKQYSLGLNLLSNKFPDLKNSLVQIPNFGLLFDGNLNINHQLWQSLFITALLIALVVLLESLITGRFVSKEMKRKNQPAADTWGIGIANIVSGLFGGMAVLSLISRSSANLQTGAKNQTPVVLYAIFMGLMTLLLIPFVSFYPFSVTAAILVWVALPLVNINEYKHLWNTSKSDFLVAMVVAILVVIQDASVAVLVGAGLSLLVVINNLANVEYRVQAFAKT